MNTVEPSVDAPTGMVGLLAALIEHSETWGKVWFGLVFWGSVLFAAARSIWPEAGSAPMLAGSLFIGGAAGLLAHRRGHWL